MQKKESNARFNFHVKRSEQNARRNLTLLMRDADMVLNVRNKFAFTPGGGS